MAELTPEQFARNSFRGVMMAIYYTFNLGDEPNVPYAFDSKTREAVNEHVKALYALFHRGKLTPRLGAQAQGDGDFQRFLQAAMTKPARAARIAQGKRTRRTPRDTGSPGSAAGNAL